MVKHQNGAQMSRATGRTSSQGRLICKYSFVRRVTLASVLVRSDGADSCLAREHQRREQESIEEPLNWMVMPLTIGSAELVVMLMMLMVIVVQSITIVYLVIDKKTKDDKRSVIVKRACLEPCWLCVENTRLSCYDHYNVEPMTAGL